MENNIFDVCLYIKYALYIEKLVFVYIKYLFLYLADIFRKTAKVKDEYKALPASES